MSEAFSIKSYAKINWTLRVLGKREDGFHELYTVFQTVSLHDTLTFQRSDRIELTCDDPSIPTADDNLIIKAALKLKELTGYEIKGHIHLTKRIPSPGGLGGGSSNAIAAILGLLRLNNNIRRGIKHWELHDVAASLGADVPFFLIGGTASGYSKGDLVIPDIPEFQAESMLIVTPNIGVSTADVFRGLGAPSLTSEALESTLTVCRNGARNFDPYHSDLINDLEPGVFAAHPEIRRVKETLLELGAQNAAMSGSGASVFAVFDNEETRQAALKALDQESTWRKFAVSTISRDEYRRETLGI